MPLTIDNTDISLSPNTVNFVSNDGIAYTAVDPVGITINFTTLDYTAPPPVPPGSPGGLIEGNFSGQMYDTVSGMSVTITDGQFRLFFLD
jgi:hypothetical protein